MKIKAVRLFLSVMLITSLLGLSIQPAFVQKVFAAEGQAPTDTLVLNSFENFGMWSVYNGDYGKVEMERETTLKTEGDSALKATFTLNTANPGTINLSWYMDQSLDLSSADKLLFDIYPLTDWGTEGEPLVFKASGSAGDLFPQMPIPELNANQWNTIEIDLSTVSPDKKASLTEITFWTHSAWGSASQSEFGYIIDNLRIQKPAALEAVTANPAGGFIERGTAVELVSSTAGTTIYYTLDGTDPKVSGSRIAYSQAISIDRNEQIKAYAMKDGYVDSEVSSYEYILTTDAEGEYFLDFDQNQLSFGNTKFVPLLSKTDNILIDGVLDDWSPYMGLQLPSRDGQVLISGWQGSNDLSAEVRFAYDEESFYISATVTDDIQHPERHDAIWSGDSIQIAFSEDGQTYGAEIGFSEGNGNPEIWRWNAGTSTLGIETIAFQSQREGNKTVYEAKLPWKAIFAESPVGKMKRVPFTMLINENDGNGRRGYVEWTGGIGKGKHAEQFGTLELVEPTEGWDVFLSGAETAIANTASQYSIYILNYSDITKTFDVVLPFDNQYQVHSAVVPAKTIFKKNILVALPQPGEYNGTVTATEAATELVEDSTIHVKVSSNPDEIRSQFTALELKLPELEGLLEAAAGEAISTDYEKVNYTVIKNFIEYGKQDIDNGLLDRASYVAEELEHLWEEATGNLNAYLTGAKASLNVPRYMTDRGEIRNYSFIADTLMAGDDSAKKRPVFFTGYGHFGQVKQDIPQFYDYGINAIQIEIGPNNVIVPEEAMPGWTPSGSGGVLATSELDTMVHYSGETSLLLKNTSPYSANVYYNLSQSFTVKPNTNYQIKAWVKGDQVKNAWIGGGTGWTHRYALPEGTYDWQEVTYDFTTGNGESSFQFLILSENITDGLWIDDISFTEGNTTANLIRNGGFEEVGATLPDKGYNISTSAIVELQRTLQNASEHNVAVTLLISPHYFPDFALQKWPEINSGSTGFIKFNIDAPKSREIITDYLNTLIPMIKDYPSLNSIVLSNESIYRSNREAGHLPKWHEFLQTVYTDINQLNSIYKTDYTSFVQVPMPAVEGPTPAYYDYVTFNNTFFADWHSWMADIVHEIAPGLPVQAKILNSLWGGDGLNMGVDGEEFAEFSQINGNDAYNFLSLGAPAFLNQLRFYDLQASIKKAPIFNSESHIIPDGDTHYIPEQATHARANLWQGAMHNGTATTFWVWERTNNIASDFTGSIMHRPDVTATIGKTNLDLNRLGEQITAFQEEKANIAILYAAPSFIYQKPNSSVDVWSTGSYDQAMNKAYEAVSFSGQKVGFVTEKQTQNEGLSQYDMVIVTDATHIKAETLEALESFVKSGGRLMVIGDNAIKFNEHNEMLSTEKRAEVMENSNTSFIANVTDAQQLRSLLLPYLEELNLDEVRLIDSTTNQPIYNVEWRNVKLGGKQLINMINYTNTTKHVYIEVNGKRYDTWNDILNMTSNVQTATMELLPSKPYLLSLEELPVLVESISIQAEGGETVITQQGGTLAMHAEIFPINAVNKEVIWSVQNDSGSASISVTGILKAISNGTVWVKATAKDGSGVSGALQITINAAAPPTDNNPSQPTDNNPTQPTGSSTGSSSTSPTPTPTPTPTPSTGKDKVEVAIDSKGHAVVNLSNDNVQAAINSSKSGTATLVLTGAEGANRVQVDIPLQQLLAVEAVNIDTVTVNMGLADISFKLKMLKNSDGTIPSNVQLTVSEVNTTTLSEDVKAKVGNNRVYDFEFTVDGKRINSFSSGDVKVELSYSLKPGENPDNIIVFYISESAGLEIVMNGKYNAITGKVEFNPQHFGKYTAMYVNATYNDIASVSWAKMSIEALAARGILDGSGGKFNPSKNMTRGDFINIVMKASGLVDNNAVSTFSDVGEGAENYHSIASAQKLGITVGLGNGNFGVNDELTRQDMAVLIYRIALKQSKVDLQVTRNTNAFTDKSSISSYAVDAVLAMHKIALLNGIGNGKFAPGGMTTRAQGAVVAYNLFKIIN